MMNSKKRKKMKVEYELDIDRSMNFIKMAINHHNKKMTLKDVEYLVGKIAKLRVFEDEAGKMNRNIAAVSGSVLSISQFTLYAETKKGNRPSFIKAAKPEIAIPLYEAFNQGLQSEGIPVATGEFGADMKVSLINDGPVTIILDTRE